MEQIHELDVSKQQKIKVSILKQERYSSIIFLIILFIACIIGCLFIITFPGMAQRHASPSIIALFIACLVVIRPVIIWQRAIRRQKKKWMNHYGQQITAAVTEIRSYSRVLTIHLEWCNPQTGKIYHYKIVVSRSNRFKLNLAHGYETGSQFPLWIDPNDPDFYWSDLHP